jgi:hypothetical protein
VSVGACICIPASCVWVVQRTHVILCPAGFANQVTCRASNTSYEVLGRAHWPSKFHVLARGWPGLRAVGYGR